MSVIADFSVAILGAGPGGLSAGARAAQRGLRHILLEAAQQYANTIQQYQLRKHVMAEPDALPLRSDLGFRAGRREEVLGEWQAGIDRTGINIRYGAAVTGIRRMDDAFHIELSGGETLRSESVIVALGTQGNPRRLGVSGDDHPRIQASLADPEAHRNETIVVVGAGDAAIENALALAPANRVILVNRAGDFPRAKLPNQRRIARAIESGALQCQFNSTVLRVDDAASGERDRCRVTLRTGEGEAVLDCDRVITRLGSVAPRRFIESIGVQYNSESEQALPELSPHYESSVPGLYMIGALAGFPLIKQALNQGYEVIERLAGNAVDPADHGVLSERLRTLPFAEDVEAKLAIIRERIGLLRNVNPLTLRELVLASRIRTPQKGDEIFHRGDFLATAYNVLQGEVTLLVPDGPAIKIREGQLAGSISLVSGRPATATAIAGDDCVLLETPHRMLRRLLQAERGAREYVDQVYIRRALKLMMTPNASAEAVHHLAESAEIVRLRAGEELFHEGAAVDRAYVTRKGSMTLSQRGPNGEVVVAYCAAGHLVDPLSRFGAGAVHAVTARATVAAEILSLDLAAFLEELERDEALLMQLQAERAAQLEQSARLRSRPEATDAIGFLMAHGVGEATNMLVIDDSLCIGCDQCETACASTHGGIARLERSAGPVLRALHLPVSCRHCEHPHCMSDCPVDAIHRQPGGEVTIADTCIGCGNCEENCPYGVIKMAEVTPRHGLISRLLGRQKPEPATLAVKCDLCTGLPAGPACVNACPTGAAIRIGANAVVELTEARAAGGR